MRHHAPSTPVHRTLLDSHSGWAFDMHGGPTSGEVSACSRVRARKGEGETSRTSAEELRRSPVGSAFQVATRIDFGWVP